MHRSFVFRRGVVVTAVLIVLSVGATFTTGRGAALDPTPTPDLHRIQLPLAFEPNQGQVDRAVDFLTRAPGYTLFLTTDGMVVAPMARDDGKRPEAVRLSLRHRAEETTFVGADPLPGIVNYLIGNDPAAWVTEVPTYRRVRHEGVYPGIDLVYYSRDGLLEFDVEIAPGSDPSAIQWVVDGAPSLDLAKDGDLRLHTDAESITLTAPVTYQETDGQRTVVDSRFVVHTLDDGRQAIGFAVAPYDATAPLVIDPRLLYGSYHGGAGLDTPNAVGVDGGGRPYIVGSTDSRNFPTTPGHVQPRPNPRKEGFVTKLSRDGLSRVYSTYLGGSGDDDVTDVAVMPAGAAFVVGNTASPDFPVRSMPADRAGVFQSSLKGSADGFVAQLNRSGTRILRSTYLGGTGFEGIDGVKLGSGVLNNGLVVWGSTPSRNFPTTQGAPVRRYRGGQSDAFLTMFDRRDLSVALSSFLGQNRKDLAENLILNPVRGDIYLLVRQRANDFAPNPSPEALKIGHFTPRTPPTATQEFPAPTARNLPGNINTLTPGNIYALTALVKLKEQVGQGPLKPDQAALAHWLASPPPRVREDQPPPPTEGSRLPFETAVLEPEFRLAVVTPECTPVAPSTTCTDRLALLSFDEELDSIDEMNFGGPTHGSFYRLNGITFDKNNRLHIIGETTDNQLEVVNPVQAQRGGARDGYVMTFDPTSGAIPFNTYLGGAITDVPTDIAIDRAGNRWVVGFTLSGNFPTTTGAAQRRRKGTNDGFIVKISAN